MKTKIEKIIKTGETPFNYDTTGGEIKISGQEMIDHVREYPDFIDDMEIINFKDMFEEDQIAMRYLLKKYYAWTEQDFTDDRCIILRHNHSDHNGYNQERWLTYYIYWMD